MKRGLLAVPLLFAVLVSVSASASASVPRANAPTATLHASIDRVGWTGGSLSLTAVVRNGKSCQFFSVPAVSGIDGTVVCGHAKVTRKGKVPPFANGRPVQFELVVSGPNGMNATELTVHQIARPTPSAKSNVVFRQSGSGSATTSAFAVPGNAAWSVDWSYGNCTLGGGFNFDVYSGNLPDFNDVGPLDLNASGSGGEAYFDSGVFYFQVITSCSWSIEVTDLVVTLPPTSTTSNVSANSVVLGPRSRSERRPDHSDRQRPPRIGLHVPVGPTDRRPRRKVSVRQWRGDATGRCASGQYNAHHLLRGCRRRSDRAESRGHFDPSARSSDVAQHEWIRNVDVGHVRDPDD